MPDAAAATAGVTDERRRRRSPFVRHKPLNLKESESTSGGLPQISGSHHSPAALYVDRTCLWDALDPDDARRYAALTDVKLAEGV